MGTKTQLARILIFFLVIAPLCFPAGPVFSAEPNQPSASSGYLQYQEPAAKAAGSTWGTIAYVLSLLALFAGVILLAYFTSRYLAAKMGSIGQGSGSAIHTTLSLGPNRNIHLVEMVGRFFVVSSTEHSIQLLFEITSPEEIIRIKESAKSAAPSFDHALSAQLSALKQMRDKFPGIFTPPVGPTSDDKREKR